jgi:hypothetical protein
MNFQEFEERIKAITTSVVATERTRSGGDEWLMNKCEGIRDCLMERIKEELGGVDNWKFMRPSGHWTGYIPEGCSKDHVWMYIKFNEQELAFDPTYIQYTRTEWSWEGCKQAVVDHCYRLRLDDVWYTEAFNERASLYPL